MNKVWKSVKWQHYVLWGLGGFLYSFAGIVVSLIINNSTKFTKESSLTSVLLFCATGLLFYGATQCGAVLANLQELQIRKQMSLVMKETVVREGLSHQKEANKTNILSAITNDIQFLLDNYFSAVLDFSVSLVSALVILVFLLQMNVFVGVSAFIFAIISVVPSVFSKKKLEEAGKEFTKKNESFLSVLSDYIQGFRVLSGYHRVNHYNQRFQSALIEREDAMRQVGRETEYVELKTRLTLVISVMGPLTVGLILLIMTPDFTITNLVAMIMAAGQLNTPVVQMIYLKSAISTTKDKREALAKIMNHELRFEEDTPASASLQQICLSKSSFGYPPNKLISDVDLTINQGEKMIVFGESGSGKSTMIDTLKGYLPLIEGNIEYLNHHKQRIPLDLASPDIAFITQSPFLFNADVRYNLTFGEGQYTDEQLETVLKQVNIYQDLGADPLAFAIKENGNNLSIGQKQRIEIARAILRNPSFIFADEITAALDNENSQNIRELLYSLPAGIIEIAHHYDREIQNNEAFRFYKVQNQILVDIG